MYQKDYFGWISRDPGIRIDPGIYHACGWSIVYPFEMDEVLAKVKELTCGLADIADGRILF